MNPDFGGFEIPIWINSFCPRIGPTTPLCLDPGNPQGPITSQFHITLRICKSIISLGTSNIITEKHFRFSSFWPYLINMSNEFLLIDYSIFPINITLFYFALEDIFKLKNFLALFRELYIWINQGEGDLHDSWL